MNREIKFRAWDNFSKEMMNDFNCYADFDNGFLRAKGSSAGQYSLMQFTGLLDKNGKEIYEGDIVLVPDQYTMPVTDEGQGPIEPCNHLVAIEFREGCFGFEIPKSDDGETGWFTFPVWSEYSDIKEIEILGNVCENPELLTQKERKHHLRS